MLRTDAVLEDRIVQSIHERVRRVQLAVKAIPKIVPFNWGGNKYYLAAVFSQESQIDVEDDPFSWDSLLVFDADLNICTGVQGLELNIEGLVDIGDYVYITGHLNDATDDRQEERSTFLCDPADMGFVFGSPFRLRDKTRYVEIDTKPYIVARPQNEPYYLFSVEGIRTRIQGYNSLACMGNLIDKVGFFNSEQGLYFWGRCDAFPNGPNVFVFTPEGIRIQLNLHTSIDLSDRTQFFRSIQPYLDSIGCDIRGVIKSWLSKKPYLHTHDRFGQGSYPDFLDLEIVRALLDAKILSDWTSALGISTEDTLDVIGPVLSTQNTNDSDVLRRYRYDHRGLFTSWYKICSYFGGFNSLDRLRASVRYVIDFERECENDRLRPGDYAFPSRLQDAFEYNATLKEGERNTPSELKECASRDVPGYRIVRKIGSGGVMTVYEALDESGGRWAVKFFDGERLDYLMAANNLSRADLVHKSQRNSVAHLRTTHPNICTLFPSIDVKAHPVLIEQYVDSTLEELLKYRGLDLREVVRYGTQIHSALVFCHRKGIWHLDVKPNNIGYLKEEDTMVLFDFGISSYGYTSKSSRAEIGGILIRPPEVFLGGEITEKFDAYSLGVVLYKMITGVFPSLLDSSYDEDNLPFTPGNGREELIKFVKNRVTSNEHHERAILHLKRTLSQWGIRSLGDLQEDHLQVVEHWSVKSTSDELYFELRLADYVAQLLSVNPIRRANIKDFYIDKELDFQLWGISSSF